VTPPSATRHEKRVADIFISYAKTDRTHAERFAPLMAKEG
jgi:hypothetical protein